MALTESEAVLNVENAAEYAGQYIKTIEPYPGGFRGRGIVTCAGGMKYQPGAWVLIKMLRMLGCRLPIQVWYLGEEECDERWISLVEPLGVECVDAHRVCELHPHPRLGGWECKAYAILHSPFEEVLFLDADNVPVRDPTYLFDDPHYQATGAIFWPDGIKTPLESKCWQAFGVPYRDEPEQESGQILIHKELCWAPLHLCNWYNKQSDFYHSFVHGDKDTFRFAWHRLNRPFAAPPGEPKNLRGTLHQSDLSGRRLFQHRIHGKWSLNRNRHVDGFELEDHCLQFLQELKSLWNPITSLTKHLTPNDRRQMDDLAGRRFDVVSAGFGRTSFLLSENALIADGPGNAAHFWWIENEALVIANANGYPMVRLARQPDGSWNGRGVYNPMIAIQLVPATSATSGLISTCQSTHEGPCPYQNQERRKNSSQRQKGSHLFDVVYPLGAGSVWNDNELRYSLRSMEKNLRDLGRVFVVGHKPDWLINVVHIPMKDIHRKNKDANLIDKVLAACRTGVSDKFLFASDDQCLLQPVSLAELKAYHIGRLEDKPADFWGGGRWKRRLRRTYGLLLHEEKTTFHYDSHVPMVYERESFESVMTSWPYQQGIGYCINTLYFNMLAIKEQYEMQGQKLTLEQPVPSADEIRAKLIGKTYLGYSDAGLTDGLRTILAELFPEPSQFEGDVAERPKPELVERDSGVLSAALG